MVYHGDGGGITSIALDRINIDRYYACTRPDIFYYAVVIRSLDGGESWAVLPDVSAMIYDFHGITVDADGMVFACGYPTICRSPDGGNTWELANGTFPDDEYQAIAADPVEPGHLLSSGGYEIGLIETFDGGDHWNEILIVRSDARTHPALNPRCSSTWLTPVPQN